MADTTEKAYAKLNISLDVTGRRIAGLGQTEVAAGRLDRVDDGRRRIEQRAIPVKNHQFVLH